MYTETPLKMVDFSLIDRRTRILLSLLPDLFYDASVLLRKVFMTRPHTMNMNGIQKNKQTMVTDTLTCEFQNQPAHLARRHSAELPLPSISTPFPTLHAKQLKQMTPLVHLPQTILFGDKDELIARFQQHNPFGTDILWHGGANHAQKTSLLVHRLDRIFPPTLNETNRFLLGSSSIDRVIVLRPHCVQQKIIGVSRMNPSLQSYWRSASSTGRHFRSFAFSHSRRAVE